MVVSVFEVFKLVMGIIIAGFFLYFMLQFAGIYSTTEIKSAEVQEYKNLKKLIEDTYIYNVPSEADLKKPPLFAAPPFVSEGASVAVSHSVLFFFKPAKRVEVYKGSLSFGFWSLDYVGALPEMRVFYSPTEYDLEDYSMIQNLTELFPQSDNPKIDFGFCSGDSELATKGRDEFLRPIRAITRSRSPQDLGLSQCTASFQDHKIKITVTKSQSAPIPDNGITISLPAAGRVGAIMFKAKDREGNLNDYRLVYKDALDLFAAVVGGVDSYKYKNKLMFESLLALSKEEAKRANLLATTYSDVNLRKQDCVPLYNKLRQKMDGEFKSSVASVINLQSYNDPVEMEKFLGLMDEANSIYAGLREKGCE